MEEMVYLIFAIMLSNFPWRYWYISCLLCLQPSGPLLFFYSGQSVGLYMNAILNILLSEKKLTQLKAYMVIQTNCWVGAGIHVTPLMGLRGIHQKPEFLSVTSPTLHRRMQHYKFTNYSLIPQSSTS